MTPKEILHSANEAGWNPSPALVLAGSTYEGVETLDPAFWQALGKARGWDETIETRECVCTHGIVCHTAAHVISAKDYERNIAGDECLHCECRRYHATYSQSPFRHALRYFETRLSNDDLDAFWQSLP